MLCLLARAAFTAIVLLHSATYVLSRSSNFSAEFLAGARLIAVGGVVETDGPIDDVDIISLSDNNHTVGAVMPETVDSFGSVMVNNTLYVIGGLGFDGLNSNSYQAYDVAANVWTNLPDFPYNISGNAAVAVNGSVFSLGGRADNYGYMNYTFKFDASTSIWRRIPTLLPVSQTNPCVVAHQSSIYLIASTGELFRSDDGAHTWKKMSSMLQKREYVACAMKPNGSIMVAGGLIGLATQNSVELYNIAENAWASTTPMRRARYVASAMVIPGTDTVIVCGGFNYQSYSIYDDCEQFIISENQWEFTTFKLNKPRVSYGLFAL